MRLCNGKAALKILVAALALTAGLAATTAARAADAHFVLISHAPDSDSWWNTIKNAIKQADEDFNVETDYRNPPNGDIADMARLVEQAAARNYDGVIVTIADYDVLKGSISKVTESTFRSSRSTPAPKSKARISARSCISASLNTRPAKPRAKRRKRRASNRSCA